MAGRCQALRVDAPFYEARFPDFTLAVPAGRDAFLQAHLRHFPGEAQGLRRLLELNGRMYDEFIRVPTDPGIAGIIRAPLRFPTLFRYRNATLAQVIDAS